MACGDNIQPEMADECSANAFSATLRSAISTSGLSLDRIQARLQARGVSVSVTALSYWQSGKRQPERQSSISAVRVLEEVLGVSPGSLLGLLPPPRPRGAPSRRSAEAKRESANFPTELLQPMLARMGAPTALEGHQQLKIATLHDRCDLSANGSQHTVHTRAVLQAAADSQDRWLLAYDHPATGGTVPLLHAHRNCRVGRSEVDMEHGLSVAELVFDQPIDRGETQLIEYSLTNNFPPHHGGHNEHFREFRRPIREYLLEINFDDTVPPRRCWRYSRRNDSSVAEQRELKIDATNSTHAIALDFGPGVFGVQWD